MRIGRAGLVAAVMGLTLSCSAQDSLGTVRHAITDGAPDDGDPGVVALLLDGLLYCTATAISDRAILTAAHCLPPAAATITVSFGSDVEAGAETWSVVGHRTDPEFDPITRHADIAVVVLDRPAPTGVVPWPLLDDPGPIATGTRIRIVGFGQTSIDHDDGGLRRRGEATITEVGPTDFRIEPDPSTTCVGDSGGPAFVTVDGVELLAGVTSGGDDACSEYGRDTRVDAFRTSLVEPFLRSLAPGTATTGDRCYGPEHCRSGICASAVDDATIRYCSAPCEVESDCPRAMSCEGPDDGRRACVFHAPTPGALGSSCIDDDDCASDLCARRSADSAYTCSAPCDRDADGSCPEGFECRASTEPPARPACFRRSPGAGESCAIGGTGPKNATFLWIVAIALLLRLSGTG